MRMRIVYKQLLTCCFAVTAGCMLQAKGQLILNRQVTASSGGSGKIGDVILQYTIGEPAISSIAGGALLFTQGFHQPEELPPLPNGTNSLFNLLLYPNPAVSNVKLQFDLFKTGSIYIEIVNSAGQLVYKDLRQCGAGKVLIILPVNHFAAGVYTVLIKSGGNLVQEKLVVQ
jgi:hypothetical protein